jgi:hypothetical protein
MIIEALLTFEHASAIRAFDPLVLDTHALFIAALTPAPTCDVFVPAGVPLVALIAEITSFGERSHRCDDIEMMIVQIQVDEVTIRSFIEHNLYTLRHMKQ